MHEQLTGHGARRPSRSHQSSSVDEPLVNQFFLNDPRLEDKRHSLKTSISARRSSQARSFRSASIEENCRESVKSSSKGSLTLVEHVSSTPPRSYGHRPRPYTASALQAARKTAPSTNVASAPKSFWFLGSFIEADERRRHSDSLSWSPITPTPGVSIDSHDSRARRPPAPLRLLHGDLPTVARSTSSGPVSYSVSAQTNDSVDEDYPPGDVIIPMAPLSLPLESCQPSGWRSRITGFFSAAKAALTMSRTEPEGEPTFQLSRLSHVSQNPSSTPQLNSHGGYGHNSQLTADLGTPRENLNAPARNLRRHKEEPEQKYGILAAPVAAHTLRSWPLQSIPAMQGLSPASATDHCHMNSSAVSSRPLSWRNTKDVFGVYAHAPTLTVLNGDLGVSRPDSLTLGQVESETLRNGDCDMILTGSGDEAQPQPAHFGSVDVGEPGPAFIGEEEVNDQTEHSVYRTATRPVRQNFNECLDQNWDRDEACRLNNISPLNPAASLSAMHRNHSQPSSTASAEINLQSGGFQTQSSSGDSGNESYFLPNQPRPNESSIPRIWTAVVRSEVTVHNRESLTPSSPPLTPTNMRTDIFSEQDDEAEWETIADSGAASRSYDSTGHRLSDNPMPNTSFIGGLSAVDGIGQYHHPNPLPEHVNPFRSSPPLIMNASRTIPRDDRRLGSRELSLMHAELFESRQTSETSTSSESESAESLVVPNSHGTFSKMIHLGPRVNFTGTPHGTGMREVGSSMAGASSPPQIWTSPHVRTSRWEGPPTPITPTSAYALPAGQPLSPSPVYSRGSRITLERAEQFGRPVSYSVTTPLPLPQPGFIKPMEHDYRLVRPIRTRMSAREQRRRREAISRVVLACCVLFPPMLLLYGYGSLDEIIATVTDGEIEHFGEREKTIGLILGWAIVAACVGGLIVGLAMHYHHA